MPLAAASPEREASSALLESWRCGTPESRISHSANASYRLPRTRHTAYLGDASLLHPERRKTASETRRTRPHEPKTKRGFTSTCVQLTTPKTHQKVQGPFLRPAACGRLRHRGGMRDRDAKPDDAGCTTQRNAAERAHYYHSTTATTTPRSDNEATQRPPRQCPPSRHADHQKQRPGPHSEAEAEPARARLIGIGRLAPRRPWGTTEVTPRGRE